MATPLPKLGILGLGIIGSRVAARAVSAGFPVSVWNRTPHAIPDLPPPLPTPADVAAKAEILQLFVSDDDALHSVMAQLAPALTPQHLVLCHATVSPQAVRDAARLASDHEAGFLDAPFTGSRDAAAQGQITYYIGGDNALLERARPVLDVSAKHIIPLGALGEASAVKIATNILAAATAASLAEAVNLLRAQGINPDTLTTALAGNSLRSGVTDLKLPVMLTGDFAPRFSAQNMRKDMRLARSLTAPQNGTLTTTLEHLYDLACQQGFAEEDFAAVLKIKAD